MRGVDIGTKHEVYAMIRARPMPPQLHLVFTEMDEITLCDRARVPRGAIVAELGARGSPIRRPRRQLCGAA